MTQIKSIKQHSESLFRPSMINDPISLKKDFLVVPNVHTKIEIHPNIVHIGAYNSYNYYFIILWEYILFW